MFGLGLPEIAIILIILLLLFGAKRLPEIGEGLGKTIKEIRKIKGEKKSESTKEKGDREGNIISEIKQEVEDIPGFKEVKEIKETTHQVKSLTKFLK